MNYAEMLSEMRTWDGIVHHVLEEFDKEPTPAILAFELLIFLATGLAFWLGPRYRSHFGAHYAVLAGGVLIFELFTAPMWNNFKLGFWGYVYKDVSWILTLGWTTTIMGTMVLVDRVWAGWGEGRRFVGYLVVMSALQEVLRDSYLPVLGVSVHQVYYVPVFLSLVIGFYKYWVPSLDGAVLPARVG